MTRTNQQTMECSKKSGVCDRNCVDECYWKAGDSEPEGQLNRLAREFLDAKRKYQGDAVADATKIKARPDIGKVIISLPIGKDLEEGKPFLCGEKKLRGLISDLHRYSSR